MFLYRGKEIGGREKLTDTCLRIIEEGDPEALEHILPHIRILRSSLFFRPLLDLLEEGEIQQQVTAALALGALGDSRCVDPLRIEYQALEGRFDDDSNLLREAIVQALGEVPSPDSVQALLAITGGNPSLMPQQGSLLVIAALGELAQQGVVKAESELIRFLTHPDPANRSAAVTELSLAYWHRPSLISSTLLQQMYDLMGDESEEVQTASRAALKNLAQLGCEKAVALIRHRRTGR